MLTEYIEAAMHLAKYEILEDDKAYYGEIPECNGVWANKSTLEACRDDLRSALEDWIMFHFVDDATLPSVSGIDINPYQAEFKAHYSEALRRAEAIDRGEANTVDAWEAASRVRKLLKTRY